MTEMMKVRPAIAGANILDPMTGDRLPDEGRPVPADPYWIGLKLRGDVVPVQEKAAGKPSTKPDKEG